MSGGGRGGGGGGAPATHHVRCIFAEPRQAEVLQIAPLVCLVRDDLPIPLLAAKVQPVGANQPLQSCGVHHVSLKKGMAEANRQVSDTAACLATRLGVHRAWAEERAYRSLRQSAFRQRPRRAATIAAVSTYASSSVFSTKFGSRLSTTHSSAKNTCTPHRPQHCRFGRCPMSC